MTTIEGYKAEAQTIDLGFTMPQEVINKLIPDLTEHPIKAQEFGMKNASDGKVVKFQTQNLRGYWDVGLRPFLNLLWRCSEIDIDSGSTFSAVGLGHNEGGEEIAFIMIKRQLDIYEVFEFVDGKTLNIYTMEKRADYQYYPEEVK